MDETTQSPAGPTDQPDQPADQPDQATDPATEQAAGAGRHRAEPELDLEVERDIPHAEDLQDPAGDARDAPATTWTASPGLHIN